MTAREAFDLVWEIADANKLDPKSLEVRGNSYLKKEAKKQQEALDRVKGFLSKVECLTEAFNE